MKIELSPDAQRLNVDLSGSLSAQEVEAAIARLADARAEMEPAVPEDRAPNSTGTFFVALEPSVVMRALRQGGMRLWLRSAGLGWLAFDLSIEQTLAVHAFIAPLATTHGEHPFTSMPEEGDPRH